MSLCYAELVDFLTMIQRFKQNFSAYNCKYFLTHHFFTEVLGAHRNVSSSCFEYTQHMFWLTNKKLILCKALTLLILYLAVKSMHI